MINRIDAGPPGSMGKVDNDRNPNRSSAPVASEAAASTRPSSDTPLLTQARQTVNQSDGIDRQRVEAIKTAIRNGEYKVDAQRVAAAFVSLEMMTGR